MAVSESVQRADYRYRYTLDNYAYKLSMLTARLSGCLDAHQLVKILEEDLPGIGIRHARLMLFEPIAGDPVAGSRWIGSKPEIDQPVLSFETCQFPPAGLYAKEEALSLALVPMVFQNEPLGYIAFDSSKISSLPPIARQVSANLKAAQLHAEVVDLSLIDALTNVYNRRFLDFFLRKEIARHQRFKRDLSILMVDVDDFKSYNDEFGHLGGDEALQEVARCLQSHLRETDIVARYGGDEFVLVLAETDESGALNAATHIQNALAVDVQLKRALSLSMGVVTMTAEKYSLSELLQRADEALYQAKFGGKNRVRISQPDLK